jgi:MscS family membrane protein
MRYKQLARPALLAFALFSLHVGAQEADPAQAVATPPRTDIPADEFDRGTPMRSGEGFMSTLDAGDYEKGAEYLDLRNLRGEASELTGAQLARRLFVVFNRATWIDVDQLVDEPAGRSNDNLPNYRDSIGVVMDEETEHRLLMQKVPRGDGVFIWKISNATVSLIPELYDTYGYPKPVEDMRRKLPDVTVLGFELFKWVIALGIGAMAYASVFFVALIIRRVLGNPDKPSHRRVFRFLVLPMGVWVVVIAMNNAATWLGRGVTAETLERISPLPILITIWAMFAGINLIRDLYSDRLVKKDKQGAAVLLRPISNAVKSLLAVGAVLMYLDNLGINITTVLAGLGVGGIAVALALQKPMEDVFGAVTLYSQQPIRVGDFCRIGNETGTIEEIGLRTSRVRTLADTLIAIPNSRLASEPIDNISARKKILFRPILRLRYDTTPEQVQQVLDGVRELLTSHERVLQKGLRVRFKEIASDALLVEVFVYLNTTNWEVYLELAEELNMKFLGVVTAAGASLSPPARMLHIEQANS